MNGPSTIVYFTDGTQAALTEPDALRGRHLDQILRIELHPDGGGVYGCVRNDGTKCTALMYQLEGVPFRVFAVVPDATAQMIAKQLYDTASGIAIAQEMPQGRPA